MITQLFLCLQYYMIELKIIMLWFVDIELIEKT